MIQPINETITTAGTAVTAGPAFSTGFAVQCTTAADIEISDSEDFTKIWTVKSGSSLSLKQENHAGSPMFYARSTSGSVDIEVVPA